MALGKTESNRLYFGGLTHAEEIPKLETDDFTFN